MLCQSLHRVKNSFSFLSPAPLRAAPISPSTNRTKREGKKDKKGRKEGFWSRLSALSAEGSGSRAGRGQTLLLCLPENKGAEDYPRIPKFVYGEIKTPLQFPCLAFMWQKPRG